MGIPGSTVIQALITLLQLHQGQGTAFVIIALLSGDLIALQDGIPLHIPLRRGQIEEPLRGLALQLAIPMDVADGRIDPAGHGDRIPHTRHYHGQLYQPDLLACKRDGSNEGRLSPWPPSAPHLLRRG